MYLSRNHKALAFFVGITLGGAVLAQATFKVPGTAAGTPAAPNVIVPQPSSAAAAPQPAKALPPAVQKAVAPRRPAQQNLPGLGVLPGPEQLTKANVLRVRSDRNEVVYVSSSMANRIATPFASPRLLGDKHQVSNMTHGQSLFVSTIHETTPVGIYITGDGPNDPVISLTLVPQAIPGQTIVLQVDAPIGGNGGGEFGSLLSNERAPTSGVYSEEIRYILRQVALNQVPEGYVEGRLPKAVGAVQNGLSVLPQARYSGPFYDVYRYVIINSTKEANIVLKEDDFYAPGVRAVAFFPVSLLTPQERTTVFVVADKSAAGG